MKLLSRILSLTISFQLMWGCNQSSSTSGPATDTATPKSNDTISISGSVASSFKLLSNLLVPQAIADGTLYLWDYSDLQDPGLIGEWKVTGSTYAISLNKIQAGDKVLKIIYSSDEDPGLNREILIDTSSSPNSILAPINKEEYFRSKIFEAQLQSDFDNGIINDARELKARFTTIKGESLDSELALLGSNGEMLDMIQSGDFNSIFKIADMVNVLRKAKVKGDFENFYKAKVELFNIGESLGVIKKGQSILSCSGNQGVFVFKDQHFDVIAMSEDSIFVQKVGGMMPLGSIDSSDQANDAIIKLVSLLTDLSKNAERNIAARIHFFTFDVDQNEMISQSCLLSGLPMTNEELVDIDDSYSKVLFDQSFIDSVELDQFSNIVEVKKALDQMYVKTVDSLQERLLASGIDEKIRNLIMVSENKLIAELYESKVDEFIASFVFPKVVTTEMEKLDFEQVGSFDSARKMIGDMYFTAFNSFTVKLKETGLESDEAKKNFGEQLIVANNVFEKRVSEFYLKEQTFNWPNYKLDFTPLLELSFEGVNDLEVAAKDTLEQLLKSYYQELLDQKVDEEVVKSIIEEQRLFGVVWISVRIQEFEAQQKMLEILK